MGDEVSAGTPLEILRIQMKITNRQNGTNESKMMS
jgi:hypothetical protein